MNVNTQINAYRGSRDVKQHEQELLEIIAARHPNFSGRMLDIGCAAGAFIGLLRSRFPDASYHGFDLAPDLVELAKQNHPHANCHFRVGNALSYSPESGFDVIVASGVLSIFEDFTEPLTTWLSWLAEGGTLYIFGRFNSRNIDTIVRFRNHMNNGDWEGGLTSYSVQTIGRFLSERGHPHEFKRFRLKTELAENPDPIRTYTIHTVDGETLVVNGANIIAEHFFLVIDA